MTDFELSAEELATEILTDCDDISPLFEDVVDQIQKLRKCGLGDEQIRTTVPGMYRIQETAANKGGLRKPAPDEIRVISLPRKYQRADWA